MCHAVSMPIQIGAVEVWFPVYAAGDNEAMYSHIGYACTSDPTQAGVDAYFTAWQTAFRGRWDSTFTLPGGFMLLGTTSGLRRYDASIASVVGNRATTTFCPNNVSVLVRKTTALGGRANRGRMFWPCPAASGVTPAGVLSGTEITAWNTALAALMPGGSAHTAAGFLGNAVLFHSNPAASETQITDLATMSKVATQRRRLRR
jgi:hypothetical protein